MDDDDEAPTFQYYARGDPDPDEARGEEEGSPGFEARPLGHVNEAYDATGVSRKVRFSTLTGDDLPRPGLCFVDFDEAAGEWACLPTAFSPEAEDDPRSPGT